MKPRVLQRGPSALLNGNAPHSKARRREVECSTVLAELRRRDSTAKELARRCALSLWQVRRALLTLQSAHAVAWVPQSGRKAHAYTRVYLARSPASSKRARA